MLAKGKNPFMKQDKYDSPKLEGGKKDLKADKKDAQTMKKPGKAKPAAASKNKKK